MGDDPEVLSREDKDNQPDYAYGVDMDDTVMAQPEEGFTQMYLPLKL
jgi:hypothetical protein